MEVVLALWVPESTPLFVSWVLLNVSSSSSVGGWLVAESSVVKEFMWAHFPADFSIGLVSILAWGDAVVSYSYLTSWASALMDSDSTSVSLLPACVISFLIPESLESFISAILLLSGLWLFVGLLGSFVVWRSVMRSIVVRNSFDSMCIVNWMSIVMDIMMDVVVIVVVCINVVLVSKML